MKNGIPNHVAIIMDGNGRWATRQGKKRTDGHYAGYKTLKNTALHILDKGVKYLSVFAFSTENFKRTEEEVNYLMDLFVSAFKSDKKFFVDNNIKVVFSGRKEPLSDKVWNVMKELEEDTKECTKGVFNVCLNYGGQAEIVDTTKKIVELVQKGELNIDELTTENYYNYLYNDLPAIDLLIRTSGEIRISNFMLYSISYSEIYFTSVCFPDFTPEEFDKALASYQDRNITKGKA
ncbi:MAG: di-trans,poly-cis-decaprenylcistransferase [Bacilli bacterium]|jgi:undecaprenyl diphosphate synthase|nr:di-trans,poly-cis-decaprenylcistransferase [Bacilli bacterium]